MDFGGAPRFLSRPRTFAVTAGKDATLACRIIGNPAPLIIWEKGNKPIRPEGRFRTAEDGDLYKLTICELCSDDSGQYICRANNPVGEAYAAVTLQVGARPQAASSRSAPHFVLKPSSLRICLGDDASFCCQVQGSPLPTVHWEKEGKALGDDTNNRYVVEAAGGSLRICCVRFSDGGTFTCTGRNDLGECQAVAALVILSPAEGPQRREQLCASDSSSSSATTVAAASSILSSPIDGRPPPRDYEKAGGPSHARTGWAPASTPTPHAAATVARARTCTVTEGKHAKLSCQVTGKPRPEIIWKKDGEIISPGRRHVIFDDDEANFVLRILFCKQSDNGCYTCTASNLAGQNYSSVLVIVKGKRAFLYCLLSSWLFPTCTLTRESIKCLIVILPKTKQHNSYMQ